MTAQYPTINLVISPEVAANPELLQQFLQKKEPAKWQQYGHFVVLRRSIDARKKQIKVNLTLQFCPPNSPPTLPNWFDQMPFGGQGTPIIIIGAGPAGLFAALTLLSHGLKPIVLERGADVRLRRRDLAAINKNHTVNPESNYCFGEGGAGTYSDGKLYTRSAKRGNLKKVLEQLVLAGAPADILVDAHPHIGTNKLPKVVANLRKVITDHGGQVHFNTRVDDFIIKNNTITGVQTTDGIFEGAATMLATGHSARDIFELLHQKKILIEAKPFAVGLRVEHPQALIDRIQYHGQERGNYLPAATYRLNAQTQTSLGHKGAFSFCMCPGGFIVPAATAPAEVVVNGMSPSKRNSLYANSGIVATVNQKDYNKMGFSGALAGMHYQKQIEQAACQAAGGQQHAPAQRLTDFLNRKTSSSLPTSSYQPGLASVNLHQILPHAIAQALQQGFKQWGRKMPAYLTENAVLLGVESRTSSPVRIPRLPNGQHPNVVGLYPVGEGAGYAGGIVSAAIDGTEAAILLTQWVKNT